MNANFLTKWNILMFSFLLLTRLLPSGLYAEANHYGLEDIQAIAPNIKIDLKYATKDNFTGQIVYNFQCCLLLKEAALRLQDVQSELESMGLGLKVWDGFRPVAAATGGLTNYVFYKRLYEVYWKKRALYGPFNRLLLYL